MWARKRKCYGFEQKIATGFYSFGFLYATQNPGGDKEEWRTRYITVKQEAIKFIIIFHMKLRNIETKFVSNY